MILLARYVVPVARPPIRDGGVRIVDGRIVQVGPREEFTGPEVVDLGRVVLLPGWVNAHAHLELSVYAGKVPPSNLLTWLTRLAMLRRKGDPALEQAGATQAAVESLRAGVTCIGDVSRRGDAWKALRDVPLRKVCFAELISVASEPPRNPVELEKVLDEVAPDRGVIPGVSPHAPYTVRARDVVGAVEIARRRALPLTSHWSETIQECRWLRQGGGVLGVLVRGFSAGDPIRPPKCSPMEYAERLGILDAGALLAHVNYIDDRELGRLAHSPSSVVLCPRSHRFFRHRNHRWREMLSAGINVCIGTDSAASLPPGSTLSILDELRFLHREHPGVPCDRLLAMGTINGARALGLADRIGTIESGKYADFVAVPLSREDVADPVEDLLRNSASPVGVWVSGIRHVPTPSASS